jgi:sec-independent protein translocase protein TatA
MGGIGFWEILIVVAVLFFVFGAKRLPEIARSIGKGLQEFKSAKDEITNEPLVKEENDKVKEEKDLGKSERNS